MVAHNQTQSQSQNRDNAAENTLRLDRAAEAENAMAALRAEVASLREQLDAALANAEQERQARISLEKMFEDALQSILAARAEYEQRHGRA